ncbi:helix-turn-helix domain-containing protein [Nitrincola iocasae]|nr:helix-turn-helix transcriptional regulator [Nitrincola iocasae]
MSEIGDRLKEERERIGLSQEEFGLVGGVARNAQSNYEKGKRAPDSDYLCAIARKGVDVLYILTGTQMDTSINGLTPDEVELLGIYRGCSDVGQRHLVAAGKAFQSLNPSYESIEVETVLAMAAEEKKSYG